MKVVRCPLFVARLVIALLTVTSSLFAAPKEPERLRVLFIGNSYTHINDLPKLTMQIASTAKPPRVLEAEFVGEGGATLERHWKSGRALEAIRKGSWDFVILQDQGTLGHSADFRSISDPKLFHEYARMFDAEIRKARAKTLFFMTWARKDSPESQALLTSAYATIADELSAHIAPVGIAWQLALKERSDLVLHDADFSHPAPAGSYLTACVIYAVMFASTPEGAAPALVSESDAAFLQRIAWRVAKDPRKAIAEVPRDARPPMPLVKLPENVVATIEAADRGRAILAASREAMGGLERLRAIKDASVRFRGKLRTPMGEMDVAGRETTILPNVVRSEMKLPMGDVVTFFDGTSGWRSTPQGIQDIPDRMKTVLQAQSARNTFNLLRGEGEFAVSFEKREKVGERDVDVIVITREGETIRLFVDALDGRIVKKSFTGMGMGGPAQMEEIYSDYREVSGVLFPYRIATTQNGAPFIEATIDDVIINGGVDAAALAAKPEK